MFGQGKYYASLTREKMELEGEEVFEVIDNKLRRGDWKLKSYQIVKNAMIDKNYKNSHYVLNTEQDIRSVVDELVAEGKDIHIYPVLHVKDPRLAVKLGLIPSVLKRHVNEPWFKHWLQRGEGTFPEESNSDYSRNLKFLEHQSIWCFETLETQKRQAVAKANSSMLMLYAPDLLYRGSRRPKTDMSLFRNPDSLTVQREDIKNNMIFINDELWNVLPVTRYAAGMKRGLFFGEEPPVDVCGTFYYYEPESTTLLAYKTKRSSFNKTTMYIDLGVKEANGNGLYYKDVTKEEYPPTRSYSQSERGPNDTVEYAEYVGSSAKPGTDDYAPYNIYDVSLLLEHAASLLPADLKLDIDEIQRRRKFPAKGGEPGVKYYAGELLDLYAAEDSFDQPLCKEASRRNIDVLVFTHMVGSYQIVDEVLDTRCREDSFRSLVYIVN